MANLRADNLTGTGGRNAIDGALFFEGESSYLSMASGEIISGTGFGTNDFTVEFWINQGVNASNYTILISLTSSTPADRFEVAFHSSTIRVYTATGSWVDTGYAPTAGVFEHIAFVRNYSGNTLKMYANGLEKWSVSNNHDYNEVYTTQIGSYGSSSYGYFEGYLSNFRILNGTALYTTNYFTPPTYKLKPIENTVLLCCQDSDNPIQEATGKTITGFGSLQESNDTELVTNGGFDIDISGWTTSGVQWTHSSGALMHFGNGNTQRNAYQNVTTVVGKKYVARVLASSAEASTAYWQIAGATINYVADNNNSAQLEYRYYFTATSTSTQIRFYSYDSGNSSNVRSYWYLASIKLAPQGEAPNVLPSVGVDEGVTFEGDTKVNCQAYMYFPTGKIEERGGYSGRMVVGGGEVNASPGTTSVIEYFNFAHFSNGVNFGSLTQARRKLASCSSSTRGIFAGGAAPGATDRIDYITIATQGDAIDFANLFTGVSDDSSQCFGASNNTRGIFAGGYNNVDTIQYITIATTADAQDFGDLISGRFDHAGFASPTRAIFAGGKQTPHGNLSSIEFVTIATKGNATNFGDMTASVRGPAGLSNNIRGLMGGGSGVTNSIEYLTIASTGRAKDFGDLFVAHQEILAGGSSNNTRGVWAGGQNPGQSSMLQSVMIQSMGNAIDFGNLTTGTSGAGSVSDSHGGLS